MVELVDGDARGHRLTDNDLKKRMKVVYPAESTNIDGKAVPTSFTNTPNSTGAVQSDNIGQDLNDSFKAFRVDIHDMDALRKNKKG